MIDDVGKLAQAPAGTNGGDLTTLLAEMLNKEGAEGSGQSGSVGMADKAAGGLDINGDGAVSGEELKLFLDENGDGKISEEELAALDENGDGVIDIDELLRFLEREIGGVPASGGGKGGGGKGEGADGKGEAAGGKGGAEEGKGEAEEGGEGGGAEGGDEAQGAAPSEGESGEGEINIDQLLDSLGIEGMDQKAKDDLMAEIDTDGSGGVSADELLQAIVDGKLPNSADAAA